MLTLSLANTPNQASAEVQPDGHQDWSTKLKNRAKAFQVGVASWYGKKFNGHPTASGESYDMYGLTAAHRTLPLGSWVRVTNLVNRRSVFVRINDRGPLAPGRIIDLSYFAAQKLGMEDRGTARVRLDVAEEEPEDTGSTIAQAYPLK